MRAHHTKTLFWIPCQFSAVERVVARISEVSSDVGQAADTREDLQLCMFNALNIIVVDAVCYDASSLIEIRTSICQTAFDLMISSGMRSHSNRAQRSDDFNFRSDLFQLLLKWFENQGGLERLSYQRKGRLKVLSLGKGACACISDATVPHETREPAPPVLDRGPSTRHFAHRPEQG